MSRLRLGRTRCEWAGNDALYRAYHDEEWGVPVHDDRALFEFLLLEGAQAGLSWITILRKRENYRAAFDNQVRARLELPRRLGAGARGGGEARVGAGG